MQHIFEISDGEFDISFHSNGSKSGFNPVIQLKSEVQYRFSDRFSGTFSAISGRHLNRESLLITRPGSGLNQSFPELTLQSLIITRTLLIGLKYHFQTSSGVKPFIGFVSGFYRLKEKDFSVTFSGRQNPLSIDDQTGSSPVTNILSGFYYKIIPRVYLNCEARYMFPLNTSSTVYIKGIAAYMGLKIDI